MIQIDIPSIEKYDEKNNLFYTIPGGTLSLEHSLISISKWEAFYNKPFFSTLDLTREESIYYIKCMTLNKNVDPNIYGSISFKDFEKIKNYMARPMTATTFAKQEGGGKSRRVITSELIYYWMISFGIPFECQKWHINRLLTLIKVCDEKNKPQKKLSKHDILSRNRELNAKRRSAMNSKG